MNEPLKSVRKCDMCGKEFIIHRGAGYLFKTVEPDTRMTIYFCGWTCKRKYERSGKKITT